jgi:hypothetical protein
VKVVTAVREAVMFYFKELSRHSQGGAEENHTTFSEDVCIHYMFNERKCKALYKINAVQSNVKLGMWKCSGTI